MTLVGRKILLHRERGSCCLVVAIALAEQSTTMQSWGSQDWAVGEWGHSGVLGSHRVGGSDWGSIAVGEWGAIAVSEWSSSQDWTVSKWGGVGQWSDWEGKWGSVTCVIKDNRLKGMKCRI